MTPKSKPTFAISIDVKTVYDRLAKASIGDIVLYKELEDLIGRPVREKHRWILESARRRCFTQDRMLFGAVSKVGVKRLSDQEIVDTSHDAITRIHRASLRAARRLTVIGNYDSLPAGHKVKHNTNASALALLNHLTKENQLKKLETKVTAATRTLPLQKTLDAFRD